MPSSEDLRQARRKKMPVCVEFEEAFQDVFGMTTKAFFAQESGFTVGKPTEGAIQASINHCLEIENEKREKVASQSKTKQRSREKHQKRIPGVR